MALPNTFASNTVSTGAELDGNFQALGDSSIHMGTLVGTNSIVFTTTTGVAAIPLLKTGMIFVGVAFATNTSAASVGINGSPPFVIYKDTVSGPVALTSGEIHTGNMIGFIYDDSLNSGAGGFHLWSLIT